MEGGTIHGPEEMASGINLKVDIQVSGSCWAGGGSDGIVGNCLGEIIVRARAGSGTSHAELVGALVVSALS